MDVSTVISAIVGLFTTGGVVYLIVENFLARKRNREEVKHLQVENKGDAVKYGVSMIEIYDEIDKIIKRETQSIQTKLDKAIERIELLESNYCCYRDNCEKRARTSAEWERMQLLEAVDRVKCKR